MIVGLYFCTCGESYVSDFPFETTSCLKCGGELKIEMEPTKRQLSLMEDRQLEHLWKLFSQVKFDTSDESITERFLIWLPTTNRFAIWLFFAECYTGEFVNLPGKLIWQEQGRVNDQECECGEHIASLTSCYYNQKLGKVLCDNCGKQEMIDRWLFEGYRNPWIRCADDPLFNRSSFRVCESVDELIEKFRQGNWSLGNAFVYKNLAFINQIDGKDEWMTIKDWCPFDSITFKRIVENDDYARKYIEKLLLYKIDNNKEPSYSIIEALI